MSKTLSNNLPRHSLIALYKAFMQPHLDYADIIYGKPNNMNICNNIENLQYGAAQAITGGYQRVVKGKIVKELGFEYLHSRGLLRKICLFHKIVVNKSPNYLYNYVSTVNHSCQTRSGGKFLCMSCRTEYFANSFFLYIIRERNDLSLDICLSVSYEVFKNLFLKFIRPTLVQCF